MTKLAILEITDGTDTVSLLAGTDTGFHLRDWRPQVIGLKGGGVYQDSSIAPFRTLVFGVDETVSEAFDLKVNGYGQDDLIQHAIDFISLLQKARDYWLSDFQNTPVYLVARSPRETNTRYGLIRNFSIRELTNPYAAPFFNAQEIATFDELTLGIERDHWLESIPGESTLLSISGIQQTSPELGRAATTANEVFFGNKQNTANITHIFVDNGGVFTDISPPAALPSTLLPAVPAVGDHLYIGSTVGPFNCVIFDIGTAAADITITPQWWSGAWINMANFQDDTVSFSNTGVQSLTFVQPLAWLTTTINGQLAYWIRLRVSAIGAGPTAPTQQNRDIYTVTKPYIDLAAAQIPGDVTALSMSRIYAYTDDATGSTANGMWKRVVWGTRSVRRGSSFAAYLNCAQSQNPTGVTVAITGGNIAFATSTGNAPTGELVQWTPAGAESMVDRVTITLDSTIAPEYYGKFHGFIRTGALVITAGQTAQVRLVVKYGRTIIHTSKISEPIGNAGTTSTHAADIGVVPLFFEIDTLNELTFTIQAAQTDSGGATIEFVDLVLIPVDEFSADAESSSVDSSEILETDYAEVESLRDFRAGIRGRVKLKANDRVDMMMTVVNNGPIGLQANAQQRLWYLFIFGEAAVQTSHIQVICTLQLFRNARYNLLRGDN